MFSKVDSVRLLPPMDFISIGIFVIDLVVDQYFHRPAAELLVLELKCSKQTVLRVL
jgi:hypothetical protein